MKISTLRKAALILAAVLNTTLASGAYAASYNLPDLGNEAQAVISPLQEKQLGADFMRQARRELDIVDDPELNEYIEQLGQKLVAHSAAAGQTFHFFIVNDPTVNAFSVPGGYVGVDTGLILTTLGEDELAAVMSHEIAHITQHHIARMMAQAKRTTLPAMAALLAGVLLAGAAGGGEGGMAAITVTTAAMAQNQLNYSREFEAEADRVGMQTLNAAGYDARAMPTFFGRLLRETRYYDTPPPFLQDHPVTTRRIAESLDEAMRLPRHPPPDNTAFFDAQAEVRVLAETNPDQLVNDFRSRIANSHGKQNEADHYGYALALMGDQKFALARHEIDVLIARHPGYLLYRIAQAEIGMAAGDYNEALGLYATAFKKAPADAALMQRYASALLKTGHAEDARVLLKQALRRDTENPALYKMLAVAAGDAGHLREAHQALAEHYYLDGNPQAAIEQLNIARRNAGNNFYYVSSIDARIKQIKDEVALYHEQ